MSVSRTTELAGTLRNLAYQPPGAYLATNIADPCGSGGDRECSRQAPIHDI